MKYSEVKKKILEARSLGYEKIPSYGYVVRWKFPNNLKASHMIDGLDILYGRFNLSEMTSEIYNEYFEKAKTMA